MPQLAAVVALYAKDPVQAALTWQGIETVTDGLGNANGEILGGLMTLLVSLAALRAGELSKGTEYPRLAGWRSGHHLPYPWADRTVDRSFWLGPDHLVCLAGGCACSQQFGQKRCKPAFECGVDLQLRVGRAKDLAYPVKPRTGADGLSAPKSITIRRENEKSKTIWRNL